MNNQLINILKNSQYLKKFNQDLFFQQIIKEKWGEIFGKFATNLHLNYYHQGCLYLEIDNPIWLGELNNYQDFLKTKINNFLPKKKLKEIKIKYKEKENKETKSLKPFLDNKIDLEDKIIKELVSKREAGYSLCYNCQKTYTKSKLCIFCQQQSINIGSD